MQWNSRTALHLSSLMETDSVKSTVYTQSESQMWKSAMPCAKQTQAKPRQIPQGVNRELLAALASNGMSPSPSFWITEDYQSLCRSLKPQKTEKQRYSTIQSLRLMFQSFFKYK